METIPHPTYYIGNIATMSQKRLKFTPDRIAWYIIIS